MKSYPVVRRLSRLAASACCASWRSLASSALAISLAACGAENGALFEEEPGGAGVSDPAPAPVLPADDAAVIPEAEGSPPDSSETPDGDLPLGAGSPSPPVSVTPVAPAEPRPTPVEPAGPSIVAVTPPDGALGVDGAENIVIEFSAPMNREATEAAYQSESVPSSSVSFVWNEAGTELTIVPNAPLAHPVGEDPDAVPRRRVSFFISSSATDLEGRGLTAPFESSFSLLRQVAFRLFALQDRDLSGSFRSNDSYGAGQCARGQINMCVGDTRVNGESEQYRGFISFALPELPEEARAIEAVLSLEITGMSGNPFAGLGGLVLEHASFDVIGAEAFEADALEEMGPIADAGRTGSIVSADVASAFMADRRERALSQYRLRFEDETDGDNTSDAIMSAWDTQAIDVSYLIP